MPRVGRWFHRLLLPFRAQSDQTIADEILSHVALHADELIGAGQPPDVARRNALISLGGFAQTVDRCQEGRRFAALLALARDLQLAVRRLLREPLFTLSAVATLALGIGSTSAIFSVARTALASPLPFPDAARRVMIFSRWTAFQEDGCAADQEIWDYRSMAHTLTAVAGWSAVPGESHAAPAARRDLTVGRVTANTFDVLGVNPSLGRGFTAEEDRTERAARRHSRSRLVASQVRRRPVGDRPQDRPRRRSRRSGWCHASRIPASPTDYTDDVTDPTEAWRVPRKIDETRLSRSHGYRAAALLAPGQTARTASAELAA